MANINQQQIPPHRSPDTLWLFLHIPKTAGSSFRNALVHHLQPDRNINIDALRGAMPRDQAFKFQIEEFIALEKATCFAFASGHIKMTEALRIRDSISRPVKFITMLREPGRRVISDYRYQCTPTHPGHEYFREKYPTIESYVEDVRSHNKMLRFLSLPGEETKDAISRVAATFAMVGLVEMYPFSVRECSRLIGKALSIGPRMNATGQTPQNSVHPNRELLARIRRLNAADQLLWNYFRERLLKLRATRRPKSGQELPTSMKMDGAH